MLDYITIGVIILILCILYYFFYKKKSIKQQVFIPQIIEHKNIKRKKHKKNKNKSINTNIVYLSIAIGDEEQGNIIIKLFEDIVPKTCNNFKLLCKNKNYKGSIFHRVIKDFMIQGGDFTNYDGTGGRSIYGNKFEDENFKIPHNKPYLLSMANSGPNSNGSQFFITTSETPHLNGKHVVFGEVIDGTDIVDYINNINVDAHDRPKYDVVITDCGYV